MVNVLVLGASGYIGEALSLALRRKGHVVYGLIRNADKGKELVKGEVHVVVGDGTKAETFEEVAKKVDVIVNSTMDFSNPNFDLDAVNAVEAAIQKVGGNKKKFVFVSGFLVCEPSDNPLTEQTPYVSEAFLSSITAEVPLFATILRKRIEAEKRVTSSKQYSGVVVRAPMVYGGSKGHFTNLFQNAEEGKVIIYGKEDAVISFVHIDDLVDGLVRTIEADVSKVESQIFSLAEPERVTQKEIAHAFARGTGKELKDLKAESAPVTFPLLGKGNLFVDPTKAQKVLGWSSGHNIIRDAQVVYRSWKAYGTPAQG